MSSFALRASTIAVATIVVATATPAQAQRRIEVPPDSMAIRTWIGIGWNVRDPLIEPLENRRVPVVRTVVPCSPAHYAGLEPGDLLLRVNERDAREDDPFAGGEGTEYRVEAERGGERFTVVFKRVRRPEEAPQPVRTAPIGSLDDWNCPSLNLLPFR